MDSATKGGMADRPGASRQRLARERDESRQVRVIVTDDRRLCRESLRLLIEACEPAIDVLEAVGAEDIPGLVRDDESHAVVLYNMAAPVGDSLRRVELLRDAVPALPIMVMCDVDDPAIARGAFMRGAQAFLPSTTPGPVMVAALRLVIAGGQYAPPALLFDGSVGSRGTADGGEHSRQLREAAIRSAFPLLTPRQSGVLALVSLGCSNRVIADVLDMRENTVKAHVKQIMRKLAVENRTQAALLADRLMS